MTQAEALREASETVLAPLAALSLAERRRRTQRLVRATTDSLIAAGYARRSIEVAVELDLRYAGQSFELRLPDRAQTRATARRSLPPPPRRAVRLPPRARRRARHAARTRPRAPAAAAPRARARPPALPLGRPRRAPSLLRGPRAPRARRRPHRPDPGSDLRGPGRRPGVHRHDARATARARQRHGGTAPDAHTAL